MIEDVNILVEPTGNQPMTDHAEQHAALTRIQRDNVNNFAEIDALENKVTENTDKINELQIELEAVQETKDAGEWEYKQDLRVMPGFFVLGNPNLTSSTNTIIINETDKNGKEHQFAGLQVGDYLELYQEAKERNEGDYGLFVIKEDKGETGLRELSLDFYSGKGVADEGETFFIKVFHANNDLDLAELDARYALKDHTHSVGSHSHPYEQIAISHGQKTYYGSNINWNNAMYMFPFERRGSSGSLYQGGRIENMGKLLIKQGNFYAKIGKSGTLIGTTGESSANHGTFIVMSVWDSSYQSSHSQQGTRLQTFYGTTIWVQDSAKGRNWTDSDSLYWWYRGAGR